MHKIFLMFEKNDNEDITIRYSNIDFISYSDKISGKRILVTI